MFYKIKGLIRQTIFMEFQANNFYNLNLKCVIQN